MKRVLKGIQKGPKGQRKVKARIVSGKYIFDGKNKWAKQLNYEYRASLTERVIRERKEGANDTQPPEAQSR